MDDADGADADHVGQAGLRAGVLAFAGFASDLRGDLTDLTDLVDWDAFADVIG